LPDSNALAWPLAALALIAALHLDIAVNRAINWDEFWHYSQIHVFLAHGWLDPLQTLHARAFAWAASLPGDPVDHIRVIRLVVFAFLMAGTASIYLMTERFASRQVALVCSLLYLSAGFVLQHGTSFRPDAMVAALLMVSLTILLRARLGVVSIAAIGVLCGLAALETIKVVLYAPAFAGVAWLRWSEAGFDRRTVLRLAAIPVTALAAFALFYILHSQSLGSPAVTSEAAAGVVARSSHKMFALGGLPYYRFILKAALMAFVFAACIVALPPTVARSTMPRAEKIALAGLWLPITVLGFYHNTAPYFYVFILPPVAVACAPVVVKLVDRYTGVAVVGILSLVALGVWAMEDRHAQTRQQQLIDGAGQIFGGPVAYFDLAGMIGNWPKANHFMTPWGQDGYLAGEVPSFRAAMERQPVPVLIENDPLFEDLFATTGPTPYFLPQDAAALRENFVPLWGPLRIAGRDLAAGAPSRTSEFLVPGTYTVGGGAVSIDGQIYPAGASIALARGPHLVGSAGPHDARLIWGDHLPLPHAPAPSPPYWAQF
jgi:hypothetical protein